METRASSDLIAASSNLKQVIYIECLTTEESATAEHSLDVIKGTVKSEDPDEADACLAAVISMIGDH